MSIPTIPTPPPNARDNKALRGWLCGCFAHWLDVDEEELQAHLPLTRYGIDSVDGVGYADLLERSLGVEVPTHALWEYPSIDALADYLADAHHSAQGMSYSSMHTEIKP